jgi:hypothetical protein
MLFGRTKGAVVTVVFGAFSPLCCQNEASADFVNPVVPVWRGAANADFYGWEIFTSAFGGPNLPNYAGTETGAALFNFGAGATINSSGNIQANGGSLSMSLYAGAWEQVAEVIVNIATIGTVVNNDSFVLGLYNNSSGGLTVTPSAMEIRSSEAAPGGQGLIQTRTYKWIVPPTGSILPRFQLNFASMSNNITLDTLSVDVRYLPAPGALALLGFAGMLVAKRRRRT